MKGLDRLCRIIGACHLHECEPAWLSGHAVRDDRDVVDLSPAIPEERFQLLGIAGIREISHVDLRAHRAALFIPETPAAWRIALLTKYCRGRGLTQAGGRVA
jgi:hypothetical protein